MYLNFDGRHVVRVVSVGELDWIVNKLFTRDPEAQPWLCLVKMERILVLLREGEPEFPCLSEALTYVYGKCIDLANHLETIGFMRFEGSRVGAEQVDERFWASFCS